MKDEELIGKIFFTNPPWSRQVVSAKVLSVKNSWWRGKLAYVKYEVHETWEDVIYTKGAWVPVKKLWPHP